MITYGVFMAPLTLMGLSLAVQLIAILMLLKFPRTDLRMGNYAENYLLFPKDGMRLVLMLLVLSCVALGISYPHMIMGHM